jgi:RNA polymerase sigma-70 factor (ECF subfamily)
MEQEVTLINNAKTDPEAFGRLYDAYYQPVFGFLLSRTYNVEVAKDLASETFFQALKNIPRYESRGKPFKSWLFAIAMAQIGNFYRSRRRWLSVAIEDAPELVAAEDYQPDVAMLAEEDAEDLRQRVEQLRVLMKQLNQKQQNILTMRFFSKLSVPEIASAMRMKEGTVKSHIHRALKKLHVLMTKQSVVEDYDRAPAQQPRTALGTPGVR